MRNKRTVIISLRSIVFLLLLVCIFDPVIKFTLSKKPFLLVLVDTSKSMSVSERLEKVKQILPLIRHNKVIYGFDTQLYLLKDSIVANGNQTNFANALGLSTLSPTGSGTQLSTVPSAFLILSDGINNSGQCPISRLGGTKQKNIPIYTIKIGETPQDILISSVNLPKIAYTEDKIPIKVNIENVGFPSVMECSSLLLHSVGADSIARGATSCEISIFENNILLQKKECSLPQSGTQTEIQFYLSLMLPGTHLCRVEISELSGELSYTNNKKDFGITILKSRVKVGWFGSPSWNFKFAALELSKNERIEFSHHLAMQSDVGTGLAPAQPIESYDVVFLENCKKWEGLHSPDKMGVRGVIIIGKNCGNISPFITLGTEYLVQSPIKVLKHQNIFNATELPPIKIYQINGLQSGAEIICATDDNKPVIAKMDRVGMGDCPFPTVIGIASNEIWKWNFNYQIKFWNNLVNLSLHKNIPKFWVEIKQPLYRLGEKIVFTAQLYDDNYIPVSNSDIFANVYLITNNQPLTTTRTVPFYSSGSGNYEGFIDFLPAGEYKYIAKVVETSMVGQGDPAPTDSITGNFKVTADLEFQNLTPDEKFLQELAQISGGKYIENINELNSINLKPQISSIQYPVSSLWLSLILIIILLSAEWTLLRR